MKRYLFILLFTSSLFSKEVYYLDNNPLLLYKIINWWSIETQRDNKKPCNKAIKVTSNSLKFKYNEKDQTLSVQLKAKFPKKMEVISKNKKQLLENVYVNKNYFKIDSTKDISSINKFIFKNISKDTYKKISSMKGDIIIQIEGYVKGLLSNSGKIALDHNGDFLRECPKINQKDQDIFIKFINKKDDTILSIYKIKRKNETNR